MTEEGAALVVDPARPVFMASGQGSQKPGMGATLLDVPEVAETFACASDMLRRDIAALATDDAPEAAAALNLSNIHKNEPKIRKQI